MTKTTKLRRAREWAAPGHGRATRRRVNQESIDEMATLRRQGLTFMEIGARVGCSERTARRYAGRVEPQLHLPSPLPKPGAQDSRDLRENLARWFSDFLYWLEGFPEPQRSVRFMSEATRLIRERLADMDPLTLELVSKDRAMKDRFLREVVGPLYGNFRSHIQFDSGIGYLPPEVSAANWRPLRERPTVPVPDDKEDEFYDANEDP